jgi:hypothetical protein
VTATLATSLRLLYFQRASGRQLDQQHIIHM